tara:strand:+ start:132 stop:545 length:414 start_codon:yes stop_codon:yes gene_type:complete
MKVSKQIADKVHALVEKRFTYVHDDKQYMMNEHWTSHANEVLAGDGFSDDCDGFSNTCAELLIKEGIDKKDVSVIYCVTETGEDHLVCGVAIEGKTWILENRHNKCYDWAGSFKPGKYEWKYFMKFDDPGQWFKVNN